MASTATDSLAAAALASGVTADGSGPASDAPSDIASFYRNRCVFITGATGFLGKVGGGMQRGWGVCPPGTKPLAHVNPTPKVMVEKLLRCTDVHTIYLLVRSKGKQTAQERLEALLESDVSRGTNGADLSPRHLLVHIAPFSHSLSLCVFQLFCRVRKERPNFAEKLVAVNGELTEPNMGLSPSDAEALAASVSIILHVAATIKFNERLKCVWSFWCGGGGGGIVQSRLTSFVSLLPRLAVKLNVIAVRNMLDFAKSLHECKAFIHISTAYAHVNR